MPKTRIVIQSRLSSSRLPAKALLPVCGMPAVVLCAMRARNRGGDVVVATSSNDTDDLLCNVLTEANIPYIRGPLDDVLQRYILATQDMAPEDIVVRLTADNLFPDGNFVDELVQTMMTQKLNFLGTQSPLDNLPYGMSAEAFTVKVLREADADTDSKFDREHVTPWIKSKYSHIFKPGKNINMSHLRCTLDDMDDYLRLNKVFIGVKDPINIVWSDLCTRLSQLKAEPHFRVPYKYKNGQLISDLTLGTAQFGMHYGAANISGQPELKQVRSMVELAVAYGVNAIDTARAYGSSEAVLGKVLNGFYDRVQVVTKLATLEELKEDELAGTIRNAVDSSVLRSCRELKLYSIPVLLLHRCEHRTAYKGRIWKRLIELKQEGLIKKLGVSVYTPPEAIEALNDPHVEHIQIPFNILDWRWKDAKLPEILSRRKDVVVHARSVLLQGILCADSQYWPVLAGVNSDLWIRKIKDVVKDLNRESIKDLCFAYVRGQSWIDSSVVGMENICQLQANLRIFQNNPLSLAECNYVEQCLSGVTEDLLLPSRWS